MKRKLIKGWMFMLAFGMATGVSAQRIELYPIEYGYTYKCIILSDLAPLGCVTEDEEMSMIKRRLSINGQTASTDAFFSPAGKDSSGVDGIWNAKMSHKLQIMSHDSGSKFMNWVEAYDACRKFNAEYGPALEWRLPTQRELMMIRVLYPQLYGFSESPEKVYFTPFKDDEYWTCTEESPTNAWCVSFSTGNTYHQSKTGTCMVRCVRAYVKGY